MTVDITTISPDPNQPRKYFDPQLVSALAANIAAQGLINPIEIDQDNLVVTGETRYRASKQLFEQAGGVNNPDNPYRQIKVSRITLTDPLERLIRQLSENYSRSGSTPMRNDDLALAAAKYATLRGLKPSDLEKLSRGSQIVREFAEIISRSSEFAADTFWLISQSPEILLASRNTTAHIARRIGNLPDSQEKKELVSLVGERKINTVSIEGIVTSIKKGKLDEARIRIRQQKRKESKEISLYLSALSILATRAENLPRKLDEDDRIAVVKYTRDVIEILQRCLSTV